MVQILGIPGEAEDFGLVWEVESADGEKLSFKLNFTNPKLISQGDETDFVYCLLNLQQFKDVEGNSLGENVIIKVNLPRMIEEGAAADSVK